MRASVNTLHTWMYTPVSRRLPGLGAGCNKLVATVHLTLNYDADVASISSQLAFAGYAIHHARGLRQAAVSKGSEDTAEDFVKARGTQGRWRLAWSFFAGSMGAWAITGPAAYAVHAGVVGMAAYALSCGLPTMFIVFFGPHVQSAWPTASSLADFAELRFGTHARALVLGISMLNMCVGLLAELTTIGALFRDFAGGGALPMILVSSFLATCYTAVRNSQTSMP